MAAYTILVLASGSSGVSDASVSVDLQTTPPLLTAGLSDDTGFSNSDGITSDGSFAGTATPGAGVDVTLNGDDMGTVTADANGMFTIGLGAGSSFDGVAVFSTSDDAGNQSSVSVSFEFVASAAPVTASLLHDTGPSAADTITSDDTYSGTAEANATIAATENGMVVGTATADSGGAWTLVPTLADGAHTLLFTATNLAGLTSTDTETLTLDTVAPADSIELVHDTGASAHDGVTNDPHLTGHTDPGASVVLSENGTTLTTLAANSSGNWTFLPNLADGPHTIEAVATNLAGLVTSNSFTFTQDTGTFVTASLVDDAGRSSSDGLTNDPALRGYAVAGVVVTFTDGATPLGNTTADGNGQWNFTPALSDGVHAIGVQATDIAGVTADVVIHIDLETMPPPVSAGLSTGGHFYGETPDPTLSGVTGPGDTVTIRKVVQPTLVPIASLFSTGVDGNGMSLADGRPDSHYQVADFTSGVIQPARALDNATIDVNGLAPDTATSSWIVPGDNAAGLYDYRTTFDLTGDDPATASIAGAWAVDGVANITLNNQFTGLTSFYGDAALTPFTIGSGFVAGVNTLDFYVINTVDQAPTGLDVQLAGTAYLAGQSTPVSTTLGSVTADGNGDWSYTPILPAGTYELVADASDGAGNVTSSTPVDFTLYDGPPPLTAGLRQDTGESATDGITNLEAIVGTSRPGAFIEISEGGQNLDFQVANQSGHWHSTFLNLPDGQHTLTIEAFDTLATTTTVSFTLLTAAPPITAALTDITGPDGSDTTSDPTIGGTTAPGATVALSEYLPPVAMPIPSLFSTGVDASGVPLASGVADPHYTVTPLATGVAQAPTMLDPNSYPLGPGGPYASDTPSAGWVTPGSDAGGFYIYRTTFSLAGFDPTSAAITGTWAADDVADIVLNGQDTGIADYYALGQHTAFSIDSGFVDGTNTLDFYVANVIDPSPTGLLVDLQGTADADYATQNAESVVGTAVADASGNWSITPFLSDGMHDISVAATDIAGNTTTGADIVFTEDSNLAAIPPSQPAMTFLAGAPAPSDAGAGAGRCGGGRGRGRIWRPARSPRRRSQFPRSHRFRRTPVRPRPPRYRRCP